MSTTLQLAAPASSTCSTRYCGKHPQERVVGVCSACLANKLSSLIYTSTALAPEDLDHFRVRSPLSNSPPVSINSPTNHHHPHQDHLQTINEEADSATQEIGNEGLLCSSLEAPSTAVNEICTEAELAGNNSAHSNIIKEQIPLAYDVVPPLEEEKPSINQDISLISEVINEEARITNLEEGKPKANPYLRANKPIKCKRSKSLSGLRGESLIKLEKEAHEYESPSNTKGEQSNTGAKKVTLRTLFQLDDEEKWRNRALMGAHTSEFELGMHEFSADYRPIEEAFDKGSIGDARKIEEAKDVHDNRTHNSHRCVPSASTLSSSVCPSIPCKFKHSVLLNSLLCRKTGDDEKKGCGSIRRPSQVHEASRTIFIRSVNEGGLTQARDEGGFIRANYIASESLRRCRSKLERSVARSSVSSSDQPASPPCVSHGVDMKSERKFNLTARALAAELPSILCSSAEAAEAMMMIPSKIEDSSGSCATQIEDLEGGQDLRFPVHNDSVAVVADIVAHRKDLDDEQAEMPLPKHIILGRPTGNAQPWAADTTVKIKANLEEVYEEGSRADAVQEEEAAAECGNGIPTYITATEPIPASQEVPMAVFCRSLSCSSSSGKAIAAAGQQGTHKVQEDCKNGGVWEAYNNKSGKGARKWPSSSRTVKIAPDQSGLLRFYLTPLRGSGRTRFSSTRRPPKRHFWSLVFV